MDGTSSSGQENGAPSEQAAPSTNYAEGSFPSSWPPHSAHAKPQAVSTGVPLHLRRLHEHSCDSRARSYKHWGSLALYGRLHKVPLRVMMYPFMPDVVSLVGCLVGLAAKSVLLAGPMASMSCSEQNYAVVLVCLVQQSAACHLRC